MFLCAPSRPQVELTQFVACCSLLLYFAAGAGAALDVVALVEAWLFDVGSVCRYVKTLAGHTSSLEQQQDSQARGWLPVVQPNGIGSSRCSFMSPLVASSDAASHATHLYAQLSLHRACRDGLLGLKATLEQQADAAGGGMRAHTDVLLVNHWLELSWHMG